MDVVCPRCGASIPAHARFCMSCGTPLDAAAAPVEERRLVSILFADLVGFTARSDEADPEDVRRALVPFHERAKDAIERFGGTLDKFIGDAAMGVFGAPVAHGDDAERAVRAGLDLLGSMRELSEADPDVGVRVAVNTGEAVVAFGEGPQVGEAVAGDVVNTASRMQAVAPRDGLVIGEETWRSVRERFVTEERDAVGVKGKAAPIRIWRVLGERRTTAPAEVAPLVGRHRELAMLGERLRLAEARRMPEAVTIVADPGIGKTRLTQEFRRELGPDVPWFAGACLPYGDGVTFRALVDVVRAAAGIDRRAEGDVARIAVGSLADRVAVDPSDRAWLLGRLEPLLGVSPEREGERPDASARESAAACARILMHAAADGPIVVELEDLHWAEAGLLEAIEHLVRGLEGTPALVLCTARPEFAERANGWGGDTIRLSELTAVETRALLHELLRRDEVADEVEDALLERAGGNPLYALEFVRMLSDTGRDLASDAVPTSVHGVIAARLDAIPAEHRALLQDASVVGTAFWPGALDALATGPGAAEDGVRELVRRGMVTVLPSSRLPGQPEYGFTHALIREVAYGRLPRSARARKHLAVGRWLEDEARESVEDLAPMLANHFAVATELAQAAGEAAEADAARGPAIRWLFAAGDAASRIDESDAFTLFERARALAPPGSPSFSEALSRSGIAGRRAHRLTGAEVLDRYDASLVIERRDGDPARIGGALVRLGSQLAVMGEGERATSAFDEAVELLEAIPPGVELARACAFRAEEEMFAGRPEVSLGWAERAVALGRTLLAEDVVVMALHIRGDDRCTLGDVEGLEDFEEALSISLTRGSASNLVISHTYVGEWRWLLEGPAAALPAYEEAMAVAERRGSLNQGTQAKMVALGLLSDLGEWDRALRWTDELLGLGPGQLDLPFEIIVRAARSWLSLMRGITDDLDDPRELVERARPTRTLQVIARVLAVAASLALARGDRASASELLREFDEVTRDVAATYRATNVLTVMRVCADLGDVERARSIATALDVGTPYERIHMDTAGAYARELDGDLAGAEAIYAEVVPRWEAFRCPFEAAAAALGRGRCLLALGRPEQARAALRAARATFVELGALPWVARVDAVPVEPLRYLALVDMEEEAQLEAAARPAGIFAGGEGKDFRVLAAGTAQNILGLVVFVLGTFAANILISRAFGGGATGAVALGVVTVGTQFAFIIAAGTRFGMDMAAVRYVAIDAGAGHLGRIRGVLTHAIGIAAVISLAAGALVFILAGPVGNALSDAATEHATVTSLRAAAIAIPFVALTYVWLGGSRGLKVMRHTLYVMWAAQPLLWIVFMLVLWQVQKSEAMAVWAYAGSWIVSAVAARFLWRSISGGHPHEDLEPGATDALVRYGAPRAPAALLSQGLFWIDYFVATYFVSTGSVTAAQVGVYSACVRVALVMVLFLTAVSYVFSPFVADLHARGERVRLDHLFKTITRWTVAGTIPILLLMLIEPGAILSVFGGARFAADGSQALRILVIGQAINVSVGAAGFVLIMAGRTGWDLIVYSLSAALDLTLAFLLVPKFGIEGAAAAQAITIAASNWLRLVLVRRFVGIFPWDGAYARLAIPSALCAIAMFAVHRAIDAAPWYERLVLVGFIGVVVYVPALLAFALTPGERTALRNGVAKLRRR